MVVVDTGKAKFVLKLLRNTCFIPLNDCHVQCEKEYREVEYIYKQRSTNTYILFFFLYD